MEDSKVFIALGTCDYAEEASGNLAQTGREISYCGWKFLTFAEGSLPSCQQYWGSTYRFAKILCQSSSLKGHHGREHPMLVSLVDNVRDFKFPIARGSFGANHRSIPWKEDDNEPLRKLVRGIAPNKEAMCIKSCRKCQL